MASKSKCARLSQVGEQAQGEEEVERKLERMGLTPDWIIQVLASDMTLLHMSTTMQKVQRPVQKGNVAPLPSLQSPNLTICCLVPLFVVMGNGSVGMHLH